MASTESTPLLPSHKSSLTVPHPKPRRAVTFDPHPTITSFNPPSSSSSSASSTRRPSTSSQQTLLPTANQPPVLSAINSKLRRRNSQTAAQRSYGPSSLPTPPSSGLGTAHAIGTGHPPSKIGPQRTTKVTQKLKLLPNPDPGEDGPDEESGREVYSQFTRIKDPTARRDAARLGKADRDRLPRVTAYCTANAYKLDELLKYFKGPRARKRGAAPKLIDECIYTPYRYTDSAESEAQQGLEKSNGRTQGQVHARRYSDSDLGAIAEENRSRQRQRQEGLLEYRDQPLLAVEEEDEQGTFDSAKNEDALSDGNASPSQSPTRTRQGTPDFDTEVHTPEVFLFDYGTVVIWGMTLSQEQQFLKEIAKFETEKLAAVDVQTENFNFYYTTEYQARIYNDFISLRDRTNYMTKLAISHALAQSVKTSLFEDLVDNTIEATKDIPERIALTGKVNLSRRQILMQVGELFILRINIHLQGSVLDSPEVMWAEPQLEPVYQAVRSYLEMNQRVGLLTERLDVIADLLTVLKDQLTHTHGEYLEWIVIILIAAEILVAAINIVVDLYAGVA